jgi:hypothetical protein
LVADTKKGPAFSKDSSKRAFISTKILSSGKDLIIDYFFQSDCNYGKTKKPETAGTDSGSENEYRRSRDVAVFVTKGSTVESTQIIDGEEVKFTEYLTRLEDTVGLDKLFAFLVRDSKEVNNTAFGNFSKIVKSFIDLDDIKIDFMKYFYASKINPHNLINSVEWSAATDLLDSIVNLQKGMDNNSNNLQFIFHRLKLYIALQDKLFSSTVLEEVENLSGIFKTLLKTSSRIWDAAYFIEKVLTERTRFELLVNAYANAKVRLSSSRTPIYGTS